MPKPHGGKLVNREIPEREKERFLEQAGELPIININEGLAKDVENIARGVFSPLEGFLLEEDYHSVLDEKRLANDLPWTLPIVLDIPNNFEVRAGDTITLSYEKGTLALMHVENMYKYDKREFAQKVYGTLDTKHPGVAKVNQMGERLLGGKIDLITEMETPFSKYNLKPVETRILFKEKGWRTVVGFQTRNAPHLGHEYVQKTALTFVDGVFINPVIGKKKAGDFRDEVILEAYDALIKHYYLKDRAVISILPFEMRYAGPREAIFHAIVRKNFGCTHFIVGRDHAGVGDFYPPYAAQDIFDEFPDLGIIPLFFKAFYYCKKCGGVVNEKTCPHGEEQHIKFSGTRIREMLIKGQRPPEEMMRPEVADIILRFKDSFVGET
ncbi:MAG: sulfate adenylyltransferase [Candidatus Freyarchaeota archaeon]|nr:sulfate adenylyltransferase [Candidatus Jordarchaeia archaeon]MBS7270056.1 sulfate adenylyltransferase [Candidatus Jordarchaeia archaeon]MBS7278336.1 sulfate adenylyltransferase [Candidatus Jordarchaeia archaeon]